MWIARNEARAVLAHLAGLHSAAPLKYFICAHEYPICMKIGVCGIACEKCPLMTKNKCPNGSQGCTPKENKMCAISTCAFKKGVRICFECPEFPCDTTKKGPIAYDYCKFIAGKGF